MSEGNISAKDITLFTGTAIVPLSTFKGCGVKPIDRDTKTFSVGLGNESYFEGCLRDCVTYIRLLYDCVNASKAGDAARRDQCADDITNFLKTVVEKAELEETKKVNDDEESEEKNGIKKVV